MLYEYPVVLRQDRNGTVIALAPDVPGTMTVGADRQEALERVHGALVAMLSARMEDHETVPQPSRPRRGQRTVLLEPTEAAKLSIYQAMRARQTTVGELARRLKWDEARIRRILDLRRRSRLEDIEAALAVLGKRLVIDVQNAA